MSEFEYDEAEREKRISEHKARIAKTEAEHNRLFGRQHVRVRMKWEDTFRHDFEMDVSEGELLGIEDPLEISPTPMYVPPLEMKPSFGGTLAAIIAVPEIQHVFDAFNTPPVRVFIETAIAGPALSTLVKMIVENVCKKLKRDVEKTKIKHAKVLLYGPDGKEIKWDE
jgi:hypothetical protein